MDLHYTRGLTWQRVTACAQWLHVRDFERCQDVKATFPIRPDYSLCDTSSAVQDERIKRQECTMLGPGDRVQASRLTALNPGSTPCAATRCCGHCFSEVYAR